MLKTLCNEARFSLTITCVGPVLVKSGHATLSGPDMTPVLANRGGQWQPYLPGSSVKGVIRSHLERVVRSLAPEVACNPFLTSDDAGTSAEVSCSSRVKACTPRDAYTLACPICRLFGCLGITGRVSISDAYTPDGSKAPTERRDGVGIDRLTGGAKNRAKFDMEVVSAGAVFQTEVALRNFEVWQLGALLLALADLEDNLIRVGSGRSRGLGNVHGHLAGEPPGLELHAIEVGLQPTPAPEQIWGLGRFLDDGSYGTNPGDLINLIHQPSTYRQGIRTIRRVSHESLDDLRRQSTADFVSRMQAWPARTAGMGM